MKGRLLEVVLAIVLGVSLGILAAGMFPTQTRSAPVPWVSGGVVAGITGSMSGSGGGGGTRPETTVAGLALEFMAKSRTGNGVLCLGMEHVTGPVRLPRDCPTGTWAWIRLGTEI